MGIDQAIIHQRTILEMSTPDPVDVRNMQCFYDSAIMNQGNTLIGADRDICGTVLAQNSHSPELVVLRPREGVDPFLARCRGMRSRFGKCLRRRGGRSRIRGLES
jgi:hypothetical protein